MAARPVYWQPICQRLSTGPAELHSSSWEFLPNRHCPTLIGRFRQNICFRKWCLRLVYWLPLIIAPSWDSACTHRPLISIPAWLSVCRSGPRHLRFRRPLTGWRALINWISRIRRKAVHTRANCPIRERSALSDQPNQVRVRLFYARTQLISQM